MNPLIHDFTLVPMSVQTQTFHEERAQVSGCTHAAKQHGACTLCAAGCAELLPRDPFDILYEDIPDESGRLPREMAVYRLLEGLAIPFWRVDHEPMATLEACRGVDEVLGIHMCKNLFLCNTQKTNFYLLLMPGEKKFKTRELSGQIGSARLSFAPEEFMEEYLHISPGAVSIMGLMNDRDGYVKLLIDEDVLREEFLGCHPCVNTASLKIRTEDVLTKFLPWTGHEYRVVHLTGE